MSDHVPSDLKELERAYRSANRVQRVKFGRRRMPKDLKFERTKELGTWMMVDRMDTVLGLNVGVLKQGICGFRFQFVGADRPSKGYPLKCLAVRAARKWFKEHCCQ